jgi:hydroxyethylthiazole kinase
VVDGVVAEELRMRDVTWADRGVRAELAAVKKTTPFVYGLTNYVAANLSANVLLAVGAAPAIGAAPGWPKAFAAGAGAMWINTAALMSSGPETLLEAARSADLAVGAGAAAYDDVVKALLAFHPTVIRGNASELIALSGGGAGGKGVETTANAAEALGAVKSLATATKSIVAVSGPIDYITDGIEIFAVPGGDVRLTKVTGAGCSLGALIAAMLAVGSSQLQATCAAHAIYAVAAERAGASTKGTGSFGVALVDELSLLDPAE